MSALSPVLRMSTQGQLIYCPACKRAHLFNAPGTPTRKGASWEWNGDAVKPTFKPSMNVQYGKLKPGREHSSSDDDWDFITYCHSFVTDGRIQFLGDCKHDLAGQTVDLPEWPGYVREGLD